MKLINSKDAPLSVWKGGSTKELWIYPEGSNFKKGDYLCRLSIATIEDASSRFTSLSNVNRVFMPLKGNFSLAINDKSPVKLKSFERFHFLGDDVAECCGIGMAFNMMLKGASGDLSFISLKDEESISFKALPFEEAGPNIHSFIYILNGNIEIENKTIFEGQIIIMKSSISSLKLSKLSSADLILGKFF